MDQKAKIVSGRHQVAPTSVEELTKALQEMRSDYLKLKMESFDKADDYGALATLYDDSQTKIKKLKKLCCEHQDERECFKQQVVSALGDPKEWNKPDGDDVKVRDITDEIGALRALRDGWDEIDPETGKVVGHLPSYHQLQEQVEKERAEGIATTEDFLKLKEEVGKHRETEDNDAQCISTLNEENEQLKEENEKLWDCLSACQTKAYDCDVGDMRTIYKDLDLQLKELPEKIEELEGLCETRLACTVRWEEQVAELKEEIVKIKKENHILYEKFQFALTNFCHNCKDCADFCNGCYSSAPDHWKVDDEPRTSDDDSDWDQDEEDSPTTNPDGLVQ
jgi:hypothetical protein